MKETGVSRRIDELGRIVIPKEIRKNLKIREGDQLEFYVEKEYVVLRKKSSLHGLNEDIIHLLEIFFLFIIVKSCLLFFIYTFYFLIFKAIFLLTIGITTKNNVRVIARTITNINMSGITVFREVFIKISTYSLSYSLPSIVHIDLTIIL